jgi:ankyrin repeat protein
MNDRLNRDEMFYRIADINIPLKENKDDVLSAMKGIKNPNFQDLNGTSYLHIACQTHCIEAIEILLGLGANPNINDNRGFSPVTFALGRINSNNAAILKLMLRYGLDLKKMEGDKTLKEWIEMFNEEELNEIIRENEA